MTDERREAFLRNIERFTEEDTKSPEVAMARLIQEGIYTEEGELAPEFGGGHNPE